MKIKQGFIVRKVGVENVVVPVGEACKSFHGMVRLNETGVFLWKFFEQEHTAEEAVQAIMAEYEAEESVVKADVEKFISIVLENKFGE